MTTRRVIDADITDRADGKTPVWDATAGTHVYEDIGAQGAGSVLQVVTAVSTTRDTRTNSALADSSLSATITPQRDDSILLIDVDGECAFHQASGSPSSRSGDVAIRNSTDAVIVAQQTRGRALVSGSSVDAHSFVPIALRGRYVVNSTAARTFVLQYASGGADITAIILGDRTGGVIMTVWEIAA